GKHVRSRDVTPHNGQLLAIDPDVTEHQPREKLVEHDNIGHVHQYANYSEQSQGQEQEIATGHNRGHKEQEQHAQVQIVVQEQTAREASRAAPGVAKRTVDRQGPVLEYPVEDTTEGHQQQQIQSLTPPCGGKAACSPGVPGHCPCQCVQGQS